MWPRAAKRGRGAKSRWRREVATSKRLLRGAFVAIRDLAFRTPIPRAPANCPVSARNALVYPACHFGQHSLSSHVCSLPACVAPARIRVRARSSRGQRQGCDARASPHPANREVPTVSGRTGSRANGAPIARPIRGRYLATSPPACKSRRCAGLRLSDITYAMILFDRLAIRSGGPLAAASSSYTGVSTFSSTQRTTGTHTPSPKPNSD